MAGNHPDKFDREIIGKKFSKEESRAIFDRVEQLVESGAITEP